MRKKISGIYQIRNTINGHVYIGSAVDTEGRFRLHKSSLSKNKHHSIHLQRAWNKYGASNFVFEILEEINIAEDLIVREQFYFDDRNPEYNICKTAGSCLGVKFSLESNLKKSLNHSMLGKFGKDHNSSKEIYQYDKDGNFIKKWYGAAEIQREMNIDPGNLRKAITKKIFSYNHFWSYNDLGNHYSKVPKQKDRSKTKKEVLQFDKAGNFIREFDSVKSANDFFGKKSSHITHCLKGKIKTCYGYEWEYK